MREFIWCFRNYTCTMGQQPNVKFLNFQKEDLDILYQVRFSNLELKLKNRVWKVLCENFFQKFIHPT